MSKIYTRALLLFQNPIVLLGTVAAVLYCSWPLGYVLNPIVAHGAFASQLEASHEPYDWLFISFDILSGVILFAGGLVQWAKTKSLTIRFSIAGYMIFAVLVIVAAILPDGCSSSSTACYSVAHSPSSVIHGLASVASVIALLASIVLILTALFGHHVSHWAKVIILSVLFCWSLVGLLALAEYHRTAENLVQYAFITVCSASLVVSMLAIEYLRYKPRHGV